MTDRVTVRIEPWRKAEWENAVEDNEEYDSLTHLIKLAVEGELSDDGPTTNGDGRGYTPDVKNAEILQRLSEVENEVRETKAVADEARTEAGQSDDDHLEQLVIDRLPSAKKDAASIESVADGLDYPKGRVDPVIRRLANGTTIVQKGIRDTDGDTTSVFWKEV